MHSAWDDLSILTTLVHNPIKVPLPCCAAAWPTRSVPQERRQRKSAVTPTTLPTRHRQLLS
jgi:hypothetical protein